MHCPRVTSVGLVLGLLGSVYGLLRFPQEVSQAVRESLSMCTDTLLPSLFPFFILSSLVIKLGISDRLGRRLAFVMAPVFHLPGDCAAAVVLGLIGGYPTGARTAAALYEKGRCTREEAQRLLTFCCACSPAFLLGAVGNGCFGNPGAGFLLLGVHWAAAMLTGFLLNRNAPLPALHSKIDQEPAAVPFFAAFADSVKESFRAMLDLFAFVLCFAAAAKLVQLSGVFSIPAQFLPLSGENPHALLMGLLDMPRWVMRLNDGTVQERMILSSLLLAWGGVSIHCQICSVLHDSALSPGSFVKGKFLHALLSVLLMAASMGSHTARCLMGGAALLLFPWHRIKKWWKTHGEYSIMEAATKGSCRK